MSTRRRRGRGPRTEQTYRKLIGGLIGGKACSVVVSEVVSTGTGEGFGCPVLLVLLLPADGFSWEGASSLSFFAYA